MFARELKSYRGHVDVHASNTSWAKIANLVQEGSRVLEIGCAEGYMSDFLKREKFCRVTGVELNPRAAAIAGPHCESVIIGDIEQGALDHANGRFDVIILADVLEHLKNPESALAATARLLMEEGCVLISVPNVAHWDVRKNLFFGCFEYTKTGLLDNTHLRFFTERSLRRLIQDAGFVVDAFDFTHRLPRYWKYGALYDRWNTPIHWLVAKLFRGLFGYQFIFKLRPTVPMPPASSTQAVLKKECVWTSQ